MSITTFENFLTEEMYEECIKTAENLLAAPHNVFTTNYFWHHEIRKDSYPVLVHNIYPETVFFNNLRDEIQKKANVILHEKSLMFYYWTKHSYIPWHNDSVYEGGVTIYLNRNWHQDFGGYFLYKDGNELKGIIPKRNFAMLQIGGVEHCTTATNSDAEIRFTIQAFVKKVIKND